MTQHSESAPTGRCHCSTPEPQALIPAWPDAARALGGISRTTLYRLVKDGELPSVTIGRRRFIAPADLAAFIEARRAAGSGGDV